MMHPSPLAATTSPSPSAEGIRKPSQHADKAYQGLAIAVMIFLLGSLLMIW